MYGRDWAGNSESDDSVGYDRRHFTDDEHPDTFGAIAVSLPIPTTLGTSQGPEPWRRVRSESWPPEQGELIPPINMNSYIVTAYDMNIIVMRARHRRPLRLYIKKAADMEHLAYVASKATKYTAGHIVLLRDDQYITTMHQIDHGDRIVVKSLLAKNVKWYQHRERTELPSQSPGSNTLTWGARGKKRKSTTLIIQDWRSDDPDEDEIVLCRSWGFKEHAQHFAGYTSMAGTRVPIVYHCEELRHYDLPPWKRPVRSWDVLAEREYEMSCICSTMPWYYGKIDCLAWPVLEVMGRTEAGDLMDWQDLRRHMPVGVPLRQLDPEEQVQRTSYGWTG